MPSRVWRVLPWVVVGVMVVLMVMGASRGWSRWTAGLPLAIAGLVAAASIRGDDLASWRAWWRTGRAKVATVALAGSAVTANVSAALESNPIGAIYGSTILVALLIFAMRGASSGAPTRS